MATVNQEYIRISPQRVHLGLNLGSIKNDLIMYFASLMIEFLMMILIFIRTLYPVERVV